MFLADMPAKVCSLTGDVIRERIRYHLDSARRAITSYDMAILKNREGADWHCIREDVEERIRAAEAMLPVIGDGPHVVSMDQWLQIFNRFFEVRTAD